MDKQKMIQLQKIQSKIRDKIDLLDDLELRAMAIREEVTKLSQQATDLVYPHLSKELEKDERVQKAKHFKTLRKSDMPIGRCGLKHWGECDARCGGSHA